MKIENTGVHYYPSSKWKTEDEVSAVKAKKPSVHQEELAPLQKEAKEMTSLLQDFHFEEVVREDKLRAIKEKMDAGTYHVSGKDVVAKLTGDLA